jgi:hypothetical protein
MSRPMKAWSLIVVIGATRRSLKEEIWKSMLGSISIPTSITEKDSSADYETKDILSVITWR